MATINMVFCDSRAVFFFGGGWGCLNWYGTGAVTPFVVKWGSNTES